MKKIRLFANRDRVTRTRIVYIALTVGTVAVAFLFVLLNRLIFRLIESSLYDNTEYEVISIISADSIGAPLSLETRVGLFRQCEHEGAERAVIPGELSQSTILDDLKALWQETLDMHASGDRLFSGESKSAILRRSNYTVTLRDFYNDVTDAKLALWCAQAFCTADNGAIYCLSVQYDSRTGDVFSETCALFDNVRLGDAKEAVRPFLRANGYSDTLADQMVLTLTARGYTGTLTLPDGLTVTLRFVAGEQYEITFR